MKAKTISRIMGWISLVCVIPFSAATNAAETGGTVDGITKINRVICKNQTTGQTVDLRRPVGTQWSCEQAGLIVTAGDVVVQRIVGFAQGVIPDAPVASASGDDGSVALIWDFVAGADSYNVYMSVNPDFRPRSSNLLLNTPMTSLAQTGLNNGVQYYFYVTALSVYGESAVSQRVSATPNANIPFDHSTAAGIECATAGCHDGSSASTSKPPTHPLTSNLCETCHTPYAWLPPLFPFDHTQTTASCSTCHDNVTATGKGPTHVATIDECDVCHTTTNWLEIPTPPPPPPPPPFDHANVAGIDCASGGCHDGSSPNTSKPDTHPPTTNNCEACHFTNAWQLLLFPFDHSQTISSCSTCHDGSIATGKGSLHIPTDTECDACHSTFAWLLITP